VGNLTTILGLGMVSIMNASPTAKDATRYM
jgi:hypothetical protein